MISAKHLGDVVVVASFLIALLMSCWLLFAHHYRQLYMFKLERLWAIEQELGMKQHLRFSPLWPQDKKFKALGLSGHVLDALVFAITALGGEALAFVRGKFSWWEVVVVLLVASVIVWVGVNERRSRLARNIRIEAELRHAKSSDR